MAERAARLWPVPATSAINVEEIVRGLRDSERPAADRLFCGLRLLPVGRAEAELAGTWRRRFAATGVTLHQADCLIAATAFQAGATLATGNAKDFPMPGIDLQNWPAGGQGRTSRCLMRVMRYGPHHAHHRVHLG